MKKIIDDMGMVSPTPVVFLLVNLLVAPLIFYAVVPLVRGELPWWSITIVFLILLLHLLALRGRNIAYAYACKREDLRDRWEKGMEMELFIRAQYHVVLTAWLLTPLIGAYVYAKEWKKKGLLTPEKVRSVGGVGLNVFRAALSVCRNLDHRSGASLELTEWLRERS